MNILIYYQNHYHTVFLESLAQGFIKRGNKVFLLTSCGKGQLHVEMAKLGVSVFTNDLPPKNIFHYIKHVFYLKRFCKEHAIDVVYSHLQFANLIAVLAQRFMNAKVIPCRHHSTDVAITSNKNSMRMDRLVNKNAKKIIVVSNAVKEQMSVHEGVDPTKIRVVNLGYNFDLYHKPDPANAARIKKEMNCEFLLIMIGRMNRSKNHIAAANVLRDLIKKGLDVKMIMMDEGAEKENIVQFLKENNILNKVLFTGFLNNTMDHLSAADLLIHPSISEASNQVVKEAALLNKPSLVCRGVGDFEEYISHEQNGFLVDKNNVVTEMVEVIERYYTKKEELQKMGSKIHDVVVKRFAIDPVCEQYLEMAN